MGNKEFSIGVFSSKEGTSLTRFPTVGEVREVFLLYHIYIIPKATKHTPINTNKAKRSLGDNENGYFSSMFSRALLNMSIDMVGNFNTLAFNDSISLLVRLAKSVLYHIENWLH